MRARDSRPGGFIYWRFLFSNEERRFFFSEEKKQKTFGLWGVRSPGPTRQSAKVFWVFFSKKNIFLYPCPNCATAGGKRKPSHAPRAYLATACRRLPRHALPV
jgi:hypothetical protein